MGKYILKRLLKSVVSLFAVMSIIIVMIFELIPRNKIFANDPAYKKIRGDNKTVYTYQKYEQLGYLDFQRKPEYCSFIYSDDAEKANRCLENDSAEQKEALAQMAGTSGKLLFQDVRPGSSKRRTGSQ